MKSLLEGMDLQKRTEWSQAIADRIAALDTWKESGVVLAFLPMPTEVDTTFLIQNALTAEKAVGVPRMYGPEIRFHRIFHLDGPWDQHPYGLSEPLVTAPVLEPSYIADEGVFVVTPGLCFDITGWRLGFGKGFYDRFITHCRNIAEGQFCFTGVCFDVQLVDKVPRGEYDCNLDALVSERGILYRRN